VRAAGVPGRAPPDPCVMRSSVARSAFWRSASIARACHSSASRSASGARELNSTASLQARRCRSG